MPKAKPSKRKADPMPSEPTDAQGAGMLSQPQPRQPKNWRLVLQQIIDCRDERDKVLMIAQDALNMSQPDPQDTGDDYVIYNGKRYVPEIARAQPTERRPGESWSCFVCHEPTDALFALCESHNLTKRAALQGEPGGRSERSEIRKSGMGTR